MGFKYHPLDLWRKKKNVNSQQCDICHLPFLLLLACLHACPRGQLCTRIPLRPYPAERLFSGLVQHHSVSPRLAKHPAAAPASSFKTPLWKCPAYATGQHTNVFYMNIWLLFKKENGNGHFIATISRLNNTTNYTTLVPNLKWCRCLKCRKCPFPFTVVMWDLKHANLLVK